MNCTEYCFRVTSHQNVYVSSDELNADMESTILTRLKGQEMRCNNMGYVMRDSIVMIGRSNGVVASSDFNGGKTIFDVSYNMALISPKPRHLIPCRVEEINKIGALAFSGLEEPSPLLITLIKQNHADTDVFKHITKGDYIVVQVLSARCQLKERQVQVSALFHAPLTREQYDQHLQDMRQRLFISGGL